jgi:hypothetical protein
MRITIYNSGLLKDIINFDRNLNYGKIYRNI